MAFTLADLPYAFNALEPHIDAMTMEIHHDRHHKAYTDNLNRHLQVPKARIKIYLTSSKIYPNILLPYVTMAVASSITTSSGRSCPLQAAENPQASLPMPSTALSVHLLL